MSMPLGSSPQIVAVRPAADEPAPSRSERPDNAAGNFGKALAEQVARQRPESKPGRSESADDELDDGAEQSSSLADTNAAVLALLAAQAQPVLAEVRSDVTVDTAQAGGTQAENGSSGMLAAMIQLQQAAVVPAEEVAPAGGVPQSPVLDGGLDGMLALGADKADKPLPGGRSLAATPVPTAQAGVVPDAGGRAATIAAAATFELPLPAEEGADVVPAASGFAGLGEMAAKGAGHAAATAAPAHEVPRVSEPVGSGRWGDAVAQRVGLMLGRGEQQIDMQLNPPHLGPMEVRLNLGNEQASVVFTSQHAAVREALAAATPKLTALLADQGIQLVDVKVASDSLQQQHHQQQQAAQQQSYPNEQGTARAAASYAFAGQDAVMANVSEGLSVRLPVARGGVSLYV
ncbi:flagellar hook-length control protein FliK [Chitinilyticum aquatile]|uniref:flagellar hook-length control protein FliK n=1 Tax=Chitinilyticum aquatile TaxID=362520 RepID=UPI00048DA5FF|nr:flagellar hook-length control protein FliK [Chitinilyticum aquatile]